MEHLPPPQSEKATLRTTKRVMALLLLFALAFLYLSTRLFSLQVFHYDEYQGRVMNEITVTSKLRARRGDILDASGNILATGRTVYRIYISPKKPHWSGMCRLYRNKVLLRSRRTGRLHLWSISRPAG